MLEFEELKLRLAALEPQIEDLKDALVEYTDTFAPGGNFTFSAMVGGKMDDPLAMAKRDVIKNFFFDYARDWYKTHA